MVFNRYFMSVHGRIKNTLNNKSRVLLAPLLLTGKAIFLLV